MKNIIFISQGAKDFTEDELVSLIKKIINHGEYQIVLLVVASSANKEVYLAIPGVCRVMDSCELEYMDSMKGIDFETIASCRDLQMHMEGGFYRLYGDYQLDKYAYYSVLSFWNTFFKENHVDAVIQAKPFHGYAYDCCDLIARKNHAKFFHIDYIGYHKSWGIYTTREINRFKLLPVYAHPCKDIPYLLDSGFDKTKSEPTPFHKPLIRKILYRIGGNLLEDFVRRLVRFDWKPQRLYQKRYKIYWSDKFFGYVKQKCVQRYMESLFCKPDYSEKFVFYPLHVEPEATIQNTTVLDNQLVVIKMLSDALPTGWSIYVKEHPVQYDFNNDMNYHRMWDGLFFRSKLFYKKLSSIPHTKIVPTETPSGELAEHAQAVASITGTVLLESVLKKKPVLVFSELTPVTFMEDAFFIQSFDDCKRAMEKIAAGFQPEYRDADAMVQRYTFQGEYVADNIVALLHQECPAD